MKTITLDTNVLRDLHERIRSRHQLAKRLLKLHEESKVRIQITTRLQNDIPRDPLKSEIESLPIVPTIRTGSIWRVGTTAVGSHDGIASEEESADANEIMNLLFPGASDQGAHHSNRVADVDHLIAHRRSGADWFITSEKAMLLNAEALEYRFGIRVISLAEFVAQCNALLSVA